MSDLTYDQAEYWYRNGVCDQTDWDLYRFYWQNGAPRFSDICRAFQITTED